jgi:hypothetical protein
VRHRLLRYPHQFNIAFVCASVDVNKAQIEVPVWQQRISRYNVKTRIKFVVNKSQVHAIDLSLKISSKKD